MRFEGLGRGLREARRGARDGYSRDLLRQRVRQERQLQSLSERASIKREQADAKAITLKEKAEVVASMHYRREVLSYRLPMVIALYCCSDPKTVFVSSSSSSASQKRALICLLRDHVDRESNSASKSSCNEGR